MASFAFAKQPSSPQKPTPRQKYPSPSKDARKPRPQSKPSKSVVADSAVDKVEPPKAKSYATKTILGQHIITCREFKLDSRKEFEFIGSYTNADQIPVYPIPEIAFVGRSNVGKSSLLNCISGANKNIAVESKVPGRTQCINLFKCKDQDGDICIFTDLPGYGFAKLGREQQREISTFVNKYLVSRDSLKLTVVIVDSRRGQQDSDNSMMEFLATEGNPFAVVATKADKLTKNELEQVPRQLQQVYQLPEGQPVLFSAESGLGKREVWKLIKDALLDRGVFSDENYELIGEGYDDVAYGDSYEEEGYDSSNDN
eukprot:gene31763-38391_t